MRANFAHLNLHTLPGNGDASARGDARPNDRTPCPRCVARGCTETLAAKERRGALERLTDEVVEDAAVRLLCVGMLKLAVDDLLSGDAARKAHAREWLMSNEVYADVARRRRLQSASHLPADEGTSLKAGADLGLIPWSFLWVVEVIWGETNKPAWLVPAAPRGGTVLNSGFPAIGESSGGGVFETSASSDPDAIRMRLLTLSRMALA